MFYLAFAGVVFVLCSFYLLMGICYRLSPQYKLDTVVAALCYRRLTVFNVRFFGLVFVWLVSGAYLTGIGV